MLRNVSVTFWLLSLLILSITVFQFYFSEGMFLDGITYSAVARHWGEGYGSAWNPFYHQNENPFIAHPPMVYVLLGTLFNWFGNAFWVENLYNFLILIFSFFIMMKLFSLLKHNKSNTIPFPIFLFACVLLMAWSYRCTMLENTLTFFLLVSTYFILLALKNQQQSGLLLGGFFIFLACMTKGPVAFFPLAIPMIYDFLFKRINLKTISNTFLLLIVPAVLLMILFYTVPDAFIFFKEYIQKQIFPSLQGQLEVHPDGHFYLLKKLFLELLPLIGCILLCVVVMKKYNKTFVIPRTSVLFICIALVAFLPLLISPKQRAFYIVPSLMFFIVSVSFILEYNIQKFEIKFNPSWVKRLNILLVLLFAGFWLYVGIGKSKYNRDEKLISDIRKIHQVIPEGAVFSADSAALHKYNAVAYLSRIGRYSIVDRDTDKYYLMDTEVNTHIDTLIWTEIPLSLERYRLFKKKGNL
jgi:4-amino-4-deoxy-L-arabinose transferase-like glycosyltransferase